jgi:DNA-binding NarL/FixJ family response regulator
MDRPLRVVVADDHPFYREGLVQSLREHGIEVVREATNAEAGIEAVAETAPDLVLMDLNMPGISGVEATRQLSKRCPTTPVLVLSVSAEEADVVEAINAGAIGYVLKESPQEEIVAAIRSAAAGQPVVSAQARLGAAAGLPRPDAHRSRQMRGRSDSGLHSGDPRHGRAARWRD